MGSSEELGKVKDSKGSGPEQISSPMIFISHDSRDAEIAEAFSKLLKSASAGLLKSFRSSSKKGGDGIEYGDEWYKKLMENLDKASDVVCLFTAQSINRPWILYEAGVAKGKTGIPVHGLAIGVPLRNITTGPFYQFQNCDDDEESLTKLVIQLSRRVKGCDPDETVVRDQVKKFKTKTKEYTKEISKKSVDGDAHEADQSSSPAKLFEEVKLMLRDLPMRIERRDKRGRNKVREQFQRVDPSRVENLIFESGFDHGDPVMLLFYMSFIREEYPWLYELGLETYRKIISGPADIRIIGLHAFQNILENLPMSLQEPGEGMDVYTYEIVKRASIFVDGLVHRMK